MTGTTSRSKKNLKKRQSDENYSRRRRRGDTQCQVEYQIGAVDMEEKKTVNFECLRADEHKSYSNAIECGIDY